MKLMEMVLFTTTALKCKCKTIVAIAMFHVVH